MRVWPCVLLVAACFGGDDHGSGPYVALTQIDAAYQTAMCQHLAACHEMDLATCMVSNVGSLGEDPELVAEALEGKLRYNGSKLAECFDALATSTCNPGDIANRRSVAQCALNVFSGALTNNEKCTNNFQCVSGVCGANSPGDTSCIGDNQCCMGECVGSLPPTPSIPPGLGDPCPLGDGGFDACAVGQYCSLQMGVCMKVKPQGQGCSTTAECADGLQCDTLMTNSCVVPPLLGDACPVGLCGEEGTYCEPGTHVCVAVGLVGVSCAAGHVCSKFLYCAADSTCQLYPRAGESCEMQQRCNDLDNYCDVNTETCIARLPNNSSCDGSYRCQSNYCDTATMRCVDQPICEVPL